MRSFLITIPFLILIIALSACGGSSEAAPSSSQDASAGAQDAQLRGQQLFVTNCSTCHGIGGIGVEGLGKPLTTSEFVANLSDEELLAFIKAGRPPDDPLNSSGVLMPPKGGNPALTDEELKEIIAYIRSIQAK